MTSLLRRFGMCGALVCLGIGLCAGITGCAVGSKSMSIDSTSKMPWFGLELKGRKPKSDGPAFRSVRAEQGQGSRIDTLGRSTKDQSGDFAGSPIRKSSTALPTTDQSLVSDSTGKDIAEIDFR